MKEKIKNKQKNRCVAFSIILLVAIIVSGCREGQSFDNKSVSTDISIPINAEDESQINNEQLNNEAENQGIENQATENPVADNKEEENQTKNDTEIENENKESENQVEDNQTTNNSEIVNILNNEIIGGKVRSIGDNSFIISRTLIDENGYVTMPEKGSPQEELVNIICTNDTVFENWTIQGGGAGIEKSESDFADIKENGGLEAEGYFDGENFVADKVIIEVYK